MHVKTAIFEGQCSSDVPNLGPQIPTSGLPESRSTADDLYWYPYELITELALLGFRNWPIRHSLDTENTYLSTGTSRISIQDGPRLASLHRSTANAPATFISE